MKKLIAMSTAGLLTVLILASTGRAEIKNVRMKIDGYLCGN